MAVLPLLNKKQVFLLICGGPGTGKTFTADIIIQCLSSHGVISRACSFMWTAVFQLNVSCPKSSIHSLIGGSQRTLCPEYIASLRDRSWPKIDEVRLKIGDCGVIIVDEVSMTNSTLLVDLDIILRQAFESKKSFGGKSIILLGDFCQLPPNDGHSLADVLASFQSTNQNIFNSNESSSVIFLQAAKRSCIENESS